MTKNIQEKTFIHSFYNIFGEVDWIKVALKLLFQLLLKMFLIESKIN